MIGLTSALSEASGKKIAKAKSREHVKPKVKVHYLAELGVLSQSCIELFATTHQTNGVLSIEYTPECVSKTGRRKFVYHTSQHM